MVKYVKIGRFAVAYDNASPTQRLKPEPPPPPLPPEPPKHNDARGSGWAAFGKVMGVIVGLCVLIIVIGAITASFDTTVADESADGTSVDAATPQGVCQRADVQELVGKEAWRMILDQSRGRLIGLAIFGLVDANAMMEQFENANVTFTGARAGQSFKNQVMCSGSMRFDASNTNAGQDIVQLPTLTWAVNFADGDGDLTSTNFTVAVDQASVFEGMLLNGKPAAEYLNDQDGQNAQATLAGNPETDQPAFAPDAAAPTDDATAASAKASEQPGSADFSSSEQKLIDGWQKAEELCRGSSDAPTVEKWCPIRDRAQAALSKAGICYGRESDESAADYDLHRCVADSYR